MADTRPLIPEGCVCFGRTAEWASRAITFCPVCDNGDPRCPQPTQPAQEWKAGDKFLAEGTISTGIKYGDGTMLVRVGLAEFKLPLSSLRPLPGKEGGR